MQETQEMWVQSLGREAPLKEEMTTHSSDQTHVFCIGRLILYHWAIREASETIVYSLWHCLSNSSLSTQIKPLSASYRMWHMLQAFPKMVSIQGLKHCHPPQCFLIEDLFLMPDISHDLSYFLLRSLSLSKIIHFLRPEIEKYLIKKYFI